MCRRATRKEHGLSHKGDQLVGFESFFFLQRITAATLAKAGIHRLCTLLVKGLVHLSCLLLDKAQHVLDAYLQRIPKQGQVVET
mmetsp:Transcript_4541/g.28839  ORF Transcript_4541/g.28839 Transcript_4541/m.28839 type:complete len:84 (-) Transcript_4541:2530-2781(-)